MSAWASPLEVATLQAQEFLQRWAAQPADQAHSSRRVPPHAAVLWEPAHTCRAAGRICLAHLKSAVNDEATRLWSGMQFDYSPFTPDALPWARIGRCQNPYFRHGDALYPFMFAAFIGFLCHLRIVPAWLILVLLSPMYVGGVQLVIIKGMRLMHAFCTTSLCFETSKAHFRLSKIALEVFVVQY